LIDEELEEEGLSWDELEKEAAQSSGCLITDR